MIWRSWLIYFQKAPHQFKFPRFLFSCRCCCLSHCTFNSRVLSWASVHSKSDLHVHFARMIFSSSSWCLKKSQGKHPWNRLRRWKYSLKLRCCCIIFAGSSKINLARFSLHCCHYSPFISSNTSSWMEFISPRKFRNFIILATSKILFWVRKILITSKLSRSSSTRLSKRFMKEKKNTQMIRLERMLFSNYSMRSSRNRIFHIKSSANSNRSILKNKWSKYCHRKFSIMNIPLHRLSWKIKHWLYFQNSRDGRRHASFEGEKRRRRRRRKIPLFRNWKFEFE